MRIIRIKNFIYQKVLPALGWIAINLLSITIRIHTEGEQIIDSIKKNKGKIVYVFWHGRQFLLVKYFSNRNIAIMSSTSRDGILQATILKKFGYGIVYGSSSKSPVRALIGAIRKMREGYTFAFAIDGPTGPLYKPKPGALYLAKKMNACIIPVTFSVKPSIILKSWDKYMLPKPFARAILLYGEPFYPSPKTDNKTIQDECLIIENQLKQMTDDVDKRILKM
jgi:lysophospholipid acyltransferase (LPLAT)-like uncharacterized protein